MPVQDLLQFIKQSPTAFQANQALADLLDKNQFIRLNECEPWNIAPGGKYYVTRNMSSVIAFSVPERAFRADQFRAATTDRR